MLNGDAGHRDRGYGPDGGGPHSRGPYAIGPNHDYEDVAHAGRKMDHLSVSTSQAPKASYLTSITSVGNTFCLKAASNS